MWARMCPNGHDFHTALGEQLSQAAPELPHTASPAAERLSSTDPSRFMLLTRVRDGSGTPGDASWDG